MRKRPARRARASVEIRTFEFAVLAERVSSSPPFQTIGNVEAVVDLGELGLHGFRARH
jgi:hypothetical protein